MKKIWIRAGMTLSISDEEARAVLTGGESAAGDVVRKIIAEGRFVFDGESYIPQVCVADYNRGNGTSFEERDVGIQFANGNALNVEPQAKKGMPRCLMATIMMSGRKSER